jgi:hypothetical protein
MVITKQKFKLNLMLVLFLFLSSQLWAMTITETEFDVVAGEFTEANASVTDQDTLQKTHPDHLLIESKVWDGAGVDPNWNGPGWYDTDGPMWGGVKTSDALKDAGTEWYEYNGFTTVGITGVGAGYVDYRWKDDYEFHSAYDGWDLKDISILVGMNDPNLSIVNYKIRIQVKNNDWTWWDNGFPTSPQPGLIDMDPSTPGILDEWLIGGSDTIGVGTKIEIKDIDIQNIRGFRMTVEQGWQAAYNNDGSPNPNANDPTNWGSPLIAEVDVNLQIMDPNTTNDFAGGVNRAELENLLAKSITLSRLAVGEGLAGDYFEDNLRMIKNIQPNYIGRAAFSWDVYPSASDPNMADDEAFFDAAQTYADQVFSDYDPDVVLEGCIFETAYSAYDPDTQDRIDMGFNGAGVEQIPVPEWVFTEFGLPVETRNFSYNDMVYADGRYENHWLPGTDVPDLTRQEAQMWFYYRARRFIDAGYEGLHLGQIHMMTENDTDYSALQSLLTRIRNYAATNARRHWVFINAHTHGIAVGGNLLFDFHMFPLRPKEVVGSPYDAILEVGHLDSIYGNSLGGVSPSGWSCTNLPYAVEIDNSVGEYDPTHSADINHFTVWGWDESCWYSHQSETFRNEWLRYAYWWVRDNDPNGYYMILGARPCADPVDIGVGFPTWYYRANTFNGGCIEGFSQEETIKHVWYSGCKDDSLSNINKTGDSGCTVDIYDFADFAEGWGN